MITLDWPINNRAFQDLAWASKAFTKRPKNKMNTDKDRNDNAP